MSANVKLIWGDLVLALKGAPGLKDVILASMARCSLALDKGGYVLTACLNLGNYQPNRKIAVYETPVHVC